MGTKTIEKSLSPEQRRRRSLPRQVLYTVDRAAPEVQKSFLLKIRWSFAALMLLALSLPVVPAVLFDVGSWPAEWRFWSRLALGLIAVLSLAAAVLSSGKPGRRLALLPLWTFLLGLLLALSLPTSDPQAASAAALGPLLILGAASLGYGMNTFFFKGADRPWAEFLAMGPWLLGAAAAGAYAFGMNEWVLGASGLATLLVLLCLHRGSRETLRRYQAGEWLWASFDLVPASCLAFLSGLAGRR